MRDGKILIVGMGRHGKDCLAQILKDGWGLNFASSSWAACEEAVYPSLKGKYGYNSIEECFNDRANHRAEWKELITQYNSPDKTRLARKILENNTIYVGLRCKEELIACQKEGLFDAIVWVEANLRKEPEPLSSNTITRDMANYVVDNNGSIHDLIIEAYKLMRWLNDR